MKKYGDLTIFSCGYDLWAIVARHDRYAMELDACGLNFYGIVIRTVRTVEKAVRITRYYERRMGRPI